jgi:hypothetical protein
MTALAYYLAAVGEREREHVPLIGPTVDRRTLTLVCRLANSSTIRSLMSDLSLKFGWLPFVHCSVIRHARMSRTCGPVLEG